MFQTIQRDDPIPQATTIGKQVKISGTLASDGNVIFDGTLEKGTINIAGELTIGNSAMIKGEVQAGKLIVNGLVEGNVIVKEDMEIGATGRINGDISVHGKFTITKGGTFNGKCDMGGIGTINTTTSIVTPISKRISLREKKEVFES
ncbi:MAG: hypothetical protein A2V81_02680 [Candidatus Abawacabacteria bacterium RBG_16_42_10]|uniref:Cell shape determination protein CcmA n=1 Tax=Candidatus Abawacabacteria bacterium RBG_16_42_10 TaxID=1817814 RepID=A0A1F4XK62_9BACT|nr:MAG: hypothetical protein A2V81_02680 [Candidatus Abawacabacteria bacterium RBG_16_42_10]